MRLKASEINKQDGREDERKGLERGVGKLPPALDPRERTPAPLQILLLGSFGLLQNGLPLPRTRTRTETWLLALLVLRAHQEIERAWLAEVLWPDARPEQSLNNLRRSLSNLRQVLGDEAWRLLSPTSHTLKFDLGGVVCDVYSFDAALARGDAASLRQAVELYRGPLLPECEADWLLGERASREQAHLKALETLAALARQRGEELEAAEWLRQALRLDPFRETTQCTLMETLAAQGDRAGMTLAYRQFRLLLHEALQSEPSDETKALYQRLREEKGQAKPQIPLPLAADTSRLHIPRPISTLVGRQEESETVAALLSTARLVTLTGTGGVGKTRMALNVAAKVAPRFRDGVWFVDLAPVTGEAAVVNAVVTTLEVGAEAGQTRLAALRGFLAGKELLLLLDNCEHLLHTCAPLVTTLLQAAPNLCILATSRQALRVTGERAWRVPSLLVPEPATSAGMQAPEALLGWPATRLFVERAQEASAAFTLTAHNACFVSDICRRLDGIALAIELAAARVNVLSAEQIAIRLEDAFRLLTQGNRAALPRQQTLRGLLDWSYALLTPEEQHLLNVLSVFAGGWTLAAAEAVTAGDAYRLDAAPVPYSLMPSSVPLSSTRITDDILDVLASLVDKSLVGMQEAEDGKVRYRLLETVRQYAHERLNESGARLLVHARHGNYFLMLAEEAKPKLKGAEQAQWLGVLEEEHDNLRQALTWYTKDREDVQAGEEGLRLGVALQGFWLAHGHLSEGQERMSALLSHPGGQRHTRVRADALNGVGTLARIQGDYARARSLHEESLAICRDLKNKQGVAASLGNLGLVAYEQGDYRAARSLQQESLTLVRELGDKQGVAASLNNLGNVAYEQSDFAAARPLYEESLAIKRELGNKRGIASALNNLGNVAHEQGDLIAARSLHQESLALARELGNKGGIALSLVNLGLLVSKHSEHSLAQSLLTEGLCLCREIGDKGTSAYALEGFADLAQRQQQPYRSVYLSGAAQGLREALGSPLSPSDQEEHNHRMTKMRTALAPDSYEAALVGGRAVAFEQAVEYALGSADDE